MPVMVCMDGFVLTHAVERSTCRSQDLVDRYLPHTGGGARPRPALHRRDGRPRGVHRGALPRARPNEGRRSAFPRAAGGTGSWSAARRRTSPAATGSTARDTVFVAMGSVLGTIKDTGGMNCAATACASASSASARSGRSRRPRSAHALGSDGRVKRLVALERALATGAGGIVSADLRMALAGGIGPARAVEPVMSTVIAGLAGRAVARVSLRTMLTEAVAGELEPLSFLDLQQGPGRTRVHPRAADPPIRACRGEHAPRPGRAGARIG